MRKFLMFVTKPQLLSNELSKLAILTISMQVYLAMLSLSSFFCYPGPPAQVSYIRISERNSFFYTCTTNFGRITHKTFSPAGQNQPIEKVLVEITVFLVILSVLEQGK